MSGDNDRRMLSGGGGNSTTTAAEEMGGMDVIGFLCLCMVLGQLMKQLSTLIKIPSTSMLTVIGFIIGMTYHHMGKFGKAIKVYSHIDAQTLLLVFLPALIYESSSSSDWHIFKVEFPQIMIMAGPMLLLAIFLTAFEFKYILSYDKFGWPEALLFGAIISATDPVAVVALLKELGASKRLSTLIEGESLLNDGTAMVVFLVLLEIVKGVEMSFGDIIIKFVRLSFGGPLLGLVGAFILQFLLNRIYNDGVLEVNSTIFMSYALFYLAEGTALHVSGILAIVVLGIMMTKEGKKSISA
jgi:sodium/hydrogen exchanger 10/11